MINDVFGTIALVTMALAETAMVAFGVVFVTLCVTLGAKIALFTLLRALI